MGTRGLFGFFYKGKFYVVYNHWDSYPDGLGEVVARVLRQTSSGEFEQWKTQLDNIKVVFQDGPPPTEADISGLEEYTDLTVSSQSTRDWYCLLRGCQGDLLSILESGYILNHVEPQDWSKPRWQEYAYICNLDKMTFDFYEDDGELIWSKPLSEIDSLKNLWIDE